MKAASSLERDVVVVGAGVAGLACALGLAQQGLKVALIGPRARIHEPTAAVLFDPRIYAVAPATVDLLERLSVWKRVDAARTSPVERMRVFGDRGDELTFDAYGAAVDRLATIVEESELLRVLDAACDYQPGIERMDSAFEGLVAAADVASVRLGDQTAVSARLVIGADGAKSAVRAAAGCSAKVTDYRQTAVVCNFRCAQPHLNTAWQWFTDEGIVALLPLPGNHVSLVWSAPAELAPQLAALDPEELSQRVTARTSAALGDLDAVGAAHMYPLRLIVVDRLIGDRVALVGDAAHVVHPLAGQGLNLGLQDVSAMLEVMRDREPFRDIGDRVLLRRYERNRAEPIALMRAATDGLARLFGINDPFARFIRNTGMAAVDRLSPLKSLLIRQALG
ncbi:MAG TPA: FAD-dependent monooxygenase [Burkholderiaceae bacterium]|nr:FAD-dependent monooxygenase [Burkholderiaceae bacterium]